MNLFALNVTLEVNPHSLTLNLKYFLFASRCWLWRSTITTAGGTHSSLVFRCSHVHVSCLLHPRFQLEPCASIKTILRHTILTLQVVNMFATIHRCEQLFSQMKQAMRTQYAVVKSSLVWCGPSVNLFIKPSHYMCFVIANIRYSFNKLWLFHCECFFGGCHFKIIASSHPELSIVAHELKTLGNNGEEVLTREARSRDSDNLTHIVLVILDDKCHDALRIWWPRICRFDSRTFRRSRIIEIYRI